MKPKDMQNGDLVLKGIKAEYKIQEENLDLIA